MTESEAIARFKSCQENTGKCEKCRFYSCCGIYDMEDTAIEALEEVQQYRQIGTVDECRTAREKQIPKKVQLRHVRKFDGFDDGECSTCGQSVSRDCDGTDNFCPNCGQKLDWSDEE